MPYIYKITSPTGKVYVGSTINRIKDRWADYYTLNCKQQRKVYASLSKHGATNHLFEVLEECCLDNMLSLECFYGEKYDVLGKNGLNLMLPKSTDTYKCMSEETRLKLSISLKGFKDRNPKKFEINQKNAKAAKLTDEYKRKMSQNMKRFIKDNPSSFINMQEKATAKKRTIEYRIDLSQKRKKWFIDNPEKAQLFKLRTTDKSRTVEARKNNSEAQKKLYKNGYIHPRAKVVLDLQTGIFYNSAREAGRLLGIKDILSKFSGHRKNNTSLIYC